MGLVLPHPVELQLLNSNLIYIHMYIYVYTYTIYMHTNVYIIRGHCKKITNMKERSKTWSWNCLMINVWNYWIGVVRKIYFPLQCFYGLQFILQTWKSFFYESSVTYCGIFFSHINGFFLRIFCSVLWYFFYRINGWKVKPDSYHKAPS